MVVERRVENGVNVYTSARNNKTQNFMLPKFYVFSGRQNPTELAKPISVEK